MFISAGTFSGTMLGNMTLETPSFIDCLDILAQVPCFEILACVQARHSSAPSDSIPSDHILLLYTLIDICARSLLQIFNRYTTLASRGKRTDPPTPDSFPSLPPLFASDFFISYRRC